MARQRTNTATPRKKLAKYAAKRDFTRTPEPRGRAQKPAAASKGLQPVFCVQQHLASHLHYDFRLEHDGVLLSWAVPKGPSLNPADKRLAMKVEDHPFDYGDFEGVIPSGYGAGVVVLWDRGTWTSENGDVAQALKDGELKFSLDGVKLKGSWVLVRTKSRSFDGGSGEPWLLIKHRDYWSGDLDILEAAPHSVKSFGGLAEVLAASTHRDALIARPPVRGGETGKLFSDIIAQVRAGAISGRSLKVTKTSRSKAPDKAKPIPASALKLGRHAPKLSNQSKILYPAAKFTKGQLVDYYRRVAPLILPHLRGRAVTFKRYPDGVDGKFFFEKRCPSHRPEWVKTARIESAHAGTIDYCMLQDLASLMWAANLAAIELHTPLALASHPDRPTTMVFDLDPGPDMTLADCANVALRLRQLLKGVGLESGVKHSGSKGLHVLVPLNTPNVSFDDTKNFARAAAMTLQKDDPKTVIATMSRAARQGKVFIDWSQNDRAKTTVCVYSVRARERPWISAPLDWGVVEGKKIPVPPTADRFKPTAKDPFGTLLAMRQALPKLL